MDEHLSPLDALVENKLVNDLIDMPVKSTTIIVTHRLSPVLKVDKIAMLEAGQLIEFGIHDELMKKRKILRFF